MSEIKNEFKEALKQRIKTDAPEQYAEPGWDKVAMGKYYPGEGSLERIGSALGPILTGVLKKNNLCLSDEKVKQFFAGISTATTPADALERMFLAGGMAVPCT